VKREREKERGRKTQAASHKLIFFLQKTKKNQDVFFNSLFLISLAIALALAEPTRRRFSSSPLREERDFFAFPSRGARA
jgi:hypothetical protein